MAWLGVKGTTLLGHQTATAYLPRLDNLPLSRTRRARRNLEIPRTFAAGIVMFEEADGGLIPGQDHIAIWLQVMPDFALLVHGVDVSPPVREQRLIACLAVIGRRVPRARLAHMLWPDVAHAQALASLRSTLRELRRHPALLAVDENRFSVGLRDVAAVDWVEATAAADYLVNQSGAPEVHVTDHALISTGAAVILLLSHPLLESWDEEWLTPEQQSFEQLRAQGLEALSRRLSTRGAHALATRAAVASVAAAPLRESAYAALIDAQLAEGNRAAAVGTFRDLARILRDELGVAPSFPFRGV